VTAEDSPSLRIEAANAFTVTFWTYLRQIDNNVLPRFWEKGGDFLCVMGDRSNSRYGTIGLEVANASGGGNVNGGVSEFWGKTRLQTGRWYFVAVAFDGSRASGQARIYLDGTLEKTTNVYPWSGRLASTAGKPWLVARRAKDLSRGLAAKLDSMLVYSTALSSTQIEQVYRGRAPSGRSADWEFDEGGGTVASDDSGNGNDAAIVNAVFTPR
jgi:Concanavalin A-like lectin/glucanases superfamily